MTMVVVVAEKRGRVVWERNCEQMVPPKLSAAGDMEE